VAIVIELGIVAMAAGLLLAPLACAPWQLYLSLGALVGGGVNCLAYTGNRYTSDDSSWCGAG
jgi:hypothetical protein